MMLADNFFAAPALKQAFDSEHGKFFRNFSALLQKKQLKNAEVRLIEKHNTILTHEVPSDEEESYMGYKSNEFVRVYRCALWLILKQNQVDSNHQLFRYVRGKDKIPSVINTQEVPDNPGKPDTPQEPGEPDKPHDEPMNRRPLRCAG